MTSEEQLSRFLKPTVELVAKRAGYVCSNPDCLASTSGPSVEPHKSIIVGEAAHIYGAKPGSSRFLAEMSFVQRRDITNAIWLCRNCHKLVDSDAIGHPVELLFEWRRAHERVLAGKLGKSAVLRTEVAEKRATIFSEVSYLAQQIVIDKPSGWEYKLTVEIMRIKFDPITKRWKSLNRGLYAKKSDIVDLDRITIWQKARLDELRRLIAALTSITESEFAAAWGEPGMPGSELAILEACDLFCDLASQLLLWEETVRFATLPHEFDDYQAAFSGPGGRILESLEAVPNSIKDVLESGQKTGTRNVTIKVDLPDQWVEKCISLFRTALAKSRGLDEEDIDWDD